MGFRMRKSFKIAPGVRLNVSKSGVGLTGGVKGARYGTHSSGRRTTMIGNPIFGTGYMKTTTSGGRAKQKQAEQERSAQEVPLSPQGLRKPGLLGPKADKALYQAIETGDADRLLQLAEAHAKNRTAALAFAGILLLSEDIKRAGPVLKELHESGAEPQNDSFVRSWGQAAAVEVAIAPGVDAVLPVSRDSIGLTLAEIYQRVGNLDRAIEVVEGLEPSAYAAVSLAELYCEAKRFDEAVEVTEGILNEDDLTALLLVYRGVAFREKGFHDAARESFKEALRSRKRQPVIRHLALFERAKSYEEQNRRAQARKDLERIMVEDSNYPGLSERLAVLK